VLQLLAQMDTTRMHTAHRGYAHHNPFTRARVLSMQRTLHVNVV
jgi:hypothetical protein